MKKNFRKIPNYILVKIRGFESPKIEVASVVLYKKDQVKVGKYKKFGIEYKENHLQPVTNIEPPISSGKYSRRNKFGSVIKRKDLPMVVKTFTHESPNFGDWSKGSHDVSLDRNVYQKDIIEPKHLTISSQILTDRDDEIAFGFKINEVLEAKAPDFNEKLLFDINLLQENFGTVEVVQSGEKLTEKRIYSKLDWEVLPPGWWKDKTILENVKRKLGKQGSEYFFDRNEFIESLSPSERYIGNSYLGNRNYFIYIFTNCVVAECPQFGNALYVLKGPKTSSWKEVFSSNKRQALNAGASRILHSGRWKSKLRSEVEGDK